MKSKSFAIAFLAIGIIMLYPFSTVSAAGIDKLVSECAHCHGKDGASTHKEMPIIGGLSATYITDSFSAYKEKTRPCESVKYVDGPNKGKSSDMCKVAEKLSKEEVKQLASHFAGKPFVRAKQKFDAAQVKTGANIHKLHCVKCHENGGSSAGDDAGILAGQWMHYLQEQFDEYAEGKREMPKKMKPKMAKLSKDDIKALLDYYASFQ